MPEAHSLRHYSHDAIDHSIEIRRKWSKKINFGGSWSGVGAWNLINVTDEDISDLHDLLDFFLQDSRDKKTVFSTHYLYFYTNDLDLLQDLSDRISSTNSGKVIESYRVDLVGQPGSVGLKDPKHQYRTYFKHRQLSEKQAVTIKRFLDSQTEIKLSPTLRSWTNTQNWFYSSANYFFDHDDMGVVYMLALINPDIIRKTMPIISTK